MNKKKILSSLLVVLMLFTAIVGLIPTDAMAAHSPSVGGSTVYTKDQIKTIVQNSYRYGEDGSEFDFANAGQMLDYELSLGYLDSVNSKGNEYTIYVNRYTGLVYYVDNITGQILTSNPYNTAELNKSQEARYDLMSQVVLAYRPRDGFTTTDVTYYSTKWAGEYAQISVSPIAGGLRVNYTLGDTSTRFMVPGQITAVAFQEHMLEPLLSTFVQLLEMYIGDYYPDRDFSVYSQDKWGGNKTLDGDYLDRRALDSYLSEMRALYKEHYSTKSEEYKIIDAARGAVSTVFSAYNLNNPADYNPNTTVGSKALEEMYERAPLTEQGIPVYVRKYNASQTGKLRDVQSVLLKYTTYNSSLLAEHEAECMYDERVEEKPVFRCAIEYTFAKDGSLVTRVPANSITYDDVNYIVASVTTLKYFGAADLAGDGYVFIPDGSGSIIEYEDFYNEERKDNVSIDLRVYGNDFTYSKASGYHNEAVTMPVFGLVSETPANSRTLANLNKSVLSTGFFAILEEGSSLSTISTRFDSNKLASAYINYTPVPNDQFSTSGSNDPSIVSSTYTMVAESRYTGSYVTRYTMLTDAALSGAAGDTAAYDTSYVGMAACYRDYLKDQGALTPLENVAEDLPLYIEALGSMNVVEKVLTFPVTVSKPLTTFDDVIKMYDELAGATEKLAAKAEACRQQAAAETQNAVLRKKYEDKAVQYDKLAAKIDNITNVHFKLTGFANGGMYFTYPTRVAWESACGGAQGFNKLLAATTEKTTGDSIFQIYPEFDFLYMSNKAWFDGINENTDISRMIDNRFASMQSYNSILGAYESLYKLVVSGDALDRLYSAFIKNYSAYDIANISVSTLGSDINSNFDPDNHVSREESLGNVVSVLDRIANEGKYNVMTTVGNSYALEYADHIIDIAIDSSHFNHSSYTIPFTGLVLHGYVNYAGSAINYVGSPEYNILRSIENGASLYYILCYQENTNFMKEDPALNDYYGVDYENWYDDVVTNYEIINSAIGDLQDYFITNHKTLVSERFVDEDERAANNAKLKAEYIDMLRSEIVDRVNKTLREMLEANNPDYFGAGVKVTVDVDKLLLQASKLLNITESDLVSSGFKTSLEAIKTEFETEYPTSTAGFEVNVLGVENYNSKYEYVTDSTAFDEEYDETIYTLNNDRVVLVTYEKDGDIVEFLLNYNVYKVTVKLSDTETITLDKYGFVRIDR